ncbi:MAG: hypothetical protein Q4A04_09660, partial [Eubacteriales bacterium]|nr:hypothetical protein [Eubacteriales bacterium]
TAALSSTNYRWTDETIESKTIEWRIDKADPTVKDSVTVTYNPNGGSATFTGGMNVEGKFNYDPSNGTTFTPNDTQNYNTVSVKADVTEDLRAATPEAPLNSAMATPSVTSSK